MTFHSSRNIFSNFLSTDVIKASNFYQKANLSLIILLATMIKLTTQQCVQANFPKVIGTANAETVITAIDYYNNIVSGYQFLAGAGFTQDPALTQCSTQVTQQVPYIALYKGTSSSGIDTDVFKKAYCMLSYSIVTIKFSSDGNALATLTHDILSTRNEKFFMIDIESGSILIAKEIPSSNRGYDPVRNMLLLTSNNMAYMMSQNTYYANGPSTFHLYGFSTVVGASSASTWVMESDTTGQPWGLVQVTSTHIVSLCQVVAVPYLIKHSMADGQKAWIYRYTENLGYYEDAYLDFVSFGSLASDAGKLAVVGSASSGGGKRLAIAVLDDLGLLSTATNADHQVYSFPNPSSTTNRVRGFNVYSKDVVRVLLYETTTHEVYLAIIRMKDIFVTYRKVSQGFQSTFVTRGLFIDDEEIFIAAPTINQIITGVTPIALTTATYGIPIIYTTLKRNACYNPGLASNFGTVYMTTSISMLVLDTAGTTYQNMGFMGTTPAINEVPLSLEINDFNTAPLLGLTDSNCPIQSLMFPDVTQPSYTFYFPVGVSKSQSIASYGPLTQICTGASTYTLSYGADDSMYKLPTGFTVSATDGTITSAGTAAIGTYYIVVFATFGAGFDQKKVKFTIIVTTNQPPYLNPALQSSYQISLGASRSLPISSAFDPDSGDIVLIDTYQSGQLSLPLFMTFNAGTYTYSISTVSFAHIGTYNIVVHLTDGIYSVMNTFQLILVNDAPVLDVLPVNQPIHIDMISTYQITSQRDPNGHTITFVAGSSNPAWAVLSEDTFTFNPTDPALVGTSHTITFHLTDTNLDSIDYSFQVTISNSPPQFASTIPLQTVHLGGDYTSNLPIISDFEGHSFTVLFYETGTTSKTLPSFIFQVGNSLFISTSDHSNVGTYSISIDLTDFLGAPNTDIMTVQVKNDAAQFDILPPSPIKAHVDMANEYVVTGFSDINGDSSITIVCSSLPTWVTCSGVTIHMFPTTMTGATISIQLNDGYVNSLTSYFVSIEILNDPPVFQSIAPTTFKVGLNHLKTFPVPIVTDTEHTPVISYQQAAPNPPALPHFMTQIGNELQIFTNDVSNVGSYPIVIIATDALGSTAQQTTIIEIVDDPPIFDCESCITDQVAIIGIITYLTLPDYYDPNGATTTIDTFESGYSQLPSFVTFTFPGTYKFYPQYKQDVGIYTLSITLNDGLQTSTYLFTLTVYDRDNLPPYLKNILSHVSNIGPPYFIKSLEKVEIFAGDVLEYELPMIVDPDSDLFEVLIKLGEAGSFAKFDEKLNVINFAPDATEAREQPYIISIKLLDLNFYPKVSQTYNLEVIVKEKKREAPFVTELIEKEIEDYYETLIDSQPSQQNQKAIIRPIGISREGLLKLRVTANKYTPVLSELNEKTIRIYLLKDDIKTRVDFTIDQVEGSQLNIQLLFNRPEVISISQAYDEIKLVIVEDIDQSQNSLRQLYSSRTLIKRGLTLNFRVPPQHSKNTKNFLSKLETSLNTSQIILISSSIVLNILLSGFLSFLWSMLNDMSSLTLLSLISISFPGSIQPIQLLIMNFIYMDVFFTDEWLQPHFDYLENNQYAISPYFESMGFISMTFSENLGSGFIFIDIIIILMFLQMLLIIFAKLSTRMLNIKEKIIAKLNFDFYLRFLYQQFQAILLGALINVQSVSIQKLLINFFLQLNFETVIEGISSFFSLIGIPILLLFIFVPIIIQVKSKEPGILQKYSVFADRLKSNSKDSIASLWNVVILIKWTLFISILIYLRDYPSLQVIFLFYVEMIYQLLMIQSKPYQEPSVFKLTLINELLISIYLYATLTLTDYVQTEDVEEQLSIRLYSGWVLLASILLTAGINFLYFVYQVYQVVHQKVKRWLMKRQLRQRKYKIDEAESELGTQSTMSALKNNVEVLLTHDQNLILQGTEQYNFSLERQLTQEPQVIELKQNKTKKKCKTKITIRLQQKDINSESYKPDTQNDVKTAKKLVRQKQQEFDNLQINDRSQINNDTLNKDNQNRNLPMDPFTHFQKERNLKPQVPSRPLYQPNFHQYLFDENTQQKHDEKEFKDVEELALGFHVVRRKREQQQIDLENQDIIAKPQIVFEQNFKLKMKQKGQIDIK